MGQSQNAQPKAPNLSKQGYHTIRRPPLRSLAAEITLYQKGEHFLSHTAYPLDAKSSELLLDNDRYYIERAAVSHPHLIALSFSDFIENSSGVSVRNQLANLKASELGKKTNVNALCSLNIFEENCRKGIGEDSAHSLSIKLHLYHEYQGHTLESQIEMRKQCEVYFQEKQLWTLIAVASSAGKTLLQSGFKEPILSPTAIKIDCRSNFKVGEWQFTHFYQQLGDDEEETNFFEEGEMFLKPSSSRVHEKPKNRKKGYNILTNYYWAPQGTAGLQSIVTLGRKKQTSSNDNKYTNNQIFSLGMAILHTCLMRPLYQSETFSEKKINTYMKEAIALRITHGLPLSSQLIKLLQRMLAWDAEDRICYPQLSQIAACHSSLHPAQSIFTTESEEPIQSGTFRSRKMNPTKSLLFVDGKGSGSICQGFGDMEHPLEQSQKMNIPCTIRSHLQPADYNINYQKIDFTIKRERREWQRFQNRIQEDSYKVKPNPNPNPCTRQLFPTISTFSFPAQTLLEDGEDNPNIESLCNSNIGVTQQKQCIDFEYEPSNDINCTNSIENSIKLLDISNIKAQDQTKEVSKQQHHSPIRVDVPKQEFEESFSNLFQAKKSKAEISREDSLLLKSSIVPIPATQAIKDEKQESLFTPPELLALIRSSVYSGHSRHSHKSPKNVNVSRLQPIIDQTPQIGASEPPMIVSQAIQAELCNSVFVKESFAKGYYEGSKVDGLRSGYGTFYYNEGGKYCGDWDNNQMHGKGTLYYADGRIAYQGDWSHDSLKGKGILYNQNPCKLNEAYDYTSFDQSEDYWVYYEGSFHNDDKWGRGVLLLSNGQKYQGTFRNDLIDGRGVFYTMNGKKIIGDWQSNQLVRVVRQEQNSKQ